MSLLKTNGVQIGQSATAANNFVWYQPAVPDGTIRLANGNSGATTDVVTINTEGSFTTASISTTTVTATTVTATNINSTSDITLKTNVGSVTNALNTVDKLQGIEFDFISTGEKSAGVSAQDLEKVLPHLVTTGEDGKKSVNYAGLSAYLIEAVKELHIIVGQLKTK